MNTKYQNNWILNDFLGIFLSIAMAAGILSLESRYLGEPGAASSKIGGLGIALAGGLIAGSILAWFQWRSLRRRYPDLSWKNWWGKTVLAFTGGWVLAIMPSLWYTGENLFQVIPPFGIPTFTVIFGSIIFGALLGMFIGLAQWSELIKHRKNASQWIGMNVFGWAMGLFLLVLSGVLFQGPTLWSIFLLTGVVGGFLAAVCVAIITSLFFREAPLNA